MEDKRYQLELYKINRCKSHSSKEFCVLKKDDCSDCIYKIDWEIVATGLDSIYINRR